MQQQSKRPRPSENNSVRDSGRDCYDAVLEGQHGNHDIRHSWLNTMHTFCAAQSESIRMEEETAISPIDSLSRQLLQVKRRLWPAAEQCAEAMDDGSSSASSEFAQARRWCNPLEPLGEGRNGGMNRMFMNRSAIKLANLDAILDFRLTQFTQAANVVGEEASFLFVDLCGGPGGFSEYIMMRCQSTGRTSMCRGFGMSLVGLNEHGSKFLTHEDFTFGWNVMLTIGTSSPHP
jgi:FtsJ-like methyltransferase